MFICQSKIQKRSKRSKGRSLKRRSNKILQVKNLDLSPKSVAVEDFFIPDFFNKILWNRAKSINLSTISNPKCKFSDKFKVQNNQSFQLLLSRKRLSQSPFLLKFLFSWMRFIRKAKFLALLDHVFRSK